MIDLNKRLIIMREKQKNPFSFQGPYKKQKRELFTPPPLLQKSSKMLFVGLKAVCFVNFLPVDLSMLLFLYVRYVVRSMSYLWSRILFCVWQYIVL